MMWKQPSSFCKISGLNRPATPARTLRRIVAAISVLHARDMTLANLLSRSLWPVLALMASLAMLGAAHAFQQFGNMFPCELCLRQRDVYWAAAAMALTGLVLARIQPRQRFLVALNVLLGMVFVTGTIVAGYHVAVEWGFIEAGCSAAGGVDVTNLDMGDLDKPMVVGNCGEVPWSMLGISMAGWNALISAGLAICSFYAARGAQAQESLA